MLHALDLAADLASGRLAPATLHARIAEALAREEPQVQAFAALDLDVAAAAMAAATGPLAGLPVGVKDVFDTADLPTTYGSPVYAGHRPACDAAIVSMARRAGGVVLGKTRTTEFAYLQPTVTTNPAAPGHTPGGSSSGSAAAVAAGMLPAAFGSQTAGSTLRPASFCGVAAVKPSYRLLPTVGLKTFSWNFDTVGIFAARVADCAFVLSAISGRDLRVHGREVDAPRIAVLRDGFEVEAGPEMQAAIDRAIAIAERGGARVRSMSLCERLVAADRAHPVIMEFEGALALAHERDHHGDALSERLRAALDRGRDISPEVYDAARSRAHSGRRRFDEIFGDIDVILMPSAPGPAPLGLEATGSPAFNRLATLIGAPAVNVPGLRAPGGEPLGLQVVAPFGRDDVALAAAHWLETRIGASD